MPLLKLLSSIFAALLLASLTALAPAPRLTSNSSSDQQLAPPAVAPARNDRTPAPQARLTETGSLAGLLAPRRRAINVPQAGRFIPGAGQ